MDAAAGLGRNPVSTRSSLSMNMSRLTRDGTTAEPVSRDQILWRERTNADDREIFLFPLQLTTCMQDWQPLPG